MGHSERSRANASNYFDLWSCATERLCRLRLWNMSMFCAMWIFILFASNIPYGEIEFGIVCFFVQHCCFLCPFITNFAVIDIPTTSIMWPQVLVAHSTPANLAHLWGQSKDSSASYGKCIVAERIETDKVAAIYLGQSLQRQTNGQTIWTTIRLLSIMASMRCVVHDFRQSCEFRAYVGVHLRVRVYAYVRHRRRE